METVVRLEGVVEKTLKRLVKDGYYKTKAEAIRAGILELGREYQMIGGREARLVSKRIREMKEEVRQGKDRMIPIEEVARRLNVKI
jgi:Arc/MetJ-type ribon-helix-helix transcriptional regulator